jgi:predicted heme/steroid binding protein
MAVFWINAIVVGILGVGSLHILAIINKDTIDRVAMGIVRDIGRYKAKKRRNMNTKGLISTIMKQDDLQDELNLILNPEDEDDRGSIPTYTDKELYEFGNGRDDKPILLGVLGHVYDVSAGSKFYGEDGDYFGFAGYDVTYSLATGCKMESCIRTKVGTTTQLSESELNEAKRWLSFFHLHDKYHLVGKIESNYVDAMLEDLLASSSTSSSSGNVEDVPESGTDSTSASETEIAEETR